MFADFPQMRLRRSPPNCGGLPQMKKEQPTPHLRLPFRSPISVGVLYSPVTVSNMTGSIVICIDQYNIRKNNPPKPTFFPHLWKPTVIRRAAPQAHLRVICGYLRPEPYGRAMNPHSLLQQQVDNPHPSFQKNLQNKKANSKTFLQRKTMGKKSPSFFTFHLHSEALTVF